MPLLSKIKSKVLPLIKTLSGKYPPTRPQIKCAFEYHGTHYGGWTICPNFLSKDSIVYSFGIGEDISFDLSIIEKYGVNVFGFDPTPKSIEWIYSQKLPKEFIFFEYGIADYDGITKFYPPENKEHVSHTMLHRPSTSEFVITVDVKKLKTIMELLGHTKIDVLKMDIEGAEYSIIQDLVNSEIEIKQILIEFHHRFPGVNISDTTRAVDSLNKQGYKIFWISKNGDEYSFTKV